MYLERCSTTTVNSETQKLIVSTVVEEAQQHSECDGDFLPDEFDDDDDDDKPKKAKV
jgi:hypothetical protein